MRTKKLALQLWREFIRDERGQSTTEYILILSAVVMIAMKFKKEFGATMMKLLTQLNTEVQQGMQDN